MAMEERQGAVSSPPAAAPTDDKSDSTVAPYKSDALCGKRIPYGRRCLIHLVDARARQNHGRPFASIPISNNIGDGFMNISYRRLANAINRCARILIASCGPATSPQPIVYVGPPDLLYQILALAGPKAGYTVCFTNPRNTPNAQLALVDESAARFIASPIDVHPLVRHCLRERSLELVTLPDLETLLDDEEVEDVPYEHEPAAVYSQPWLQLQSLDKSGRPKLVTLKHGFAATIDAWSLLSYNDYKYRYAQKNVLCTIPCFHVAGLIHSLVSNVWLDSTVFLPPPLPLTTDLVHGIIKRTSIAAALLPVSVMTAMVGRHEYQSCLRKLQSITYVGGDLPDSAWDYLSARVALTPAIASPEVGALPMLPSSPAHRNHVRFNDEHSSMQFRTPSTSGTLHELLLTKDEVGSQVHPVFSTFTTTTEYSTKLFFSPHPSEQGMWHFAGHKDNILTLWDGQDFNPLAMEQIIADAPCVKACIVGVRSQTCAMIELNHATQPVQALEEIWPMIERANLSLPRAARLSHDLLLFTTPGRPLPMTAQPHVRRHEAYVQYKAELDELYASQETAPPRRDYALDFRSARSAEMSLMPLLRATIGVAALNSEDDIFERGLDSIQALSLLRQINAVRPPVPLQIHDLYDHPTAASLALALVTGPTPASRNSTRLSKHMRLSIRTITAPGSAGDSSKRRTSSVQPPDSAATTAVEHMPHHPGNSQHRFSVAQTDKSVANTDKALPSLPDEPWTERISSWVSHRTGLTEFVPAIQAGWCCGCLGRRRKGKG